jgi:phosphatidylglycerophosphate synthase
MTSSLPRRPLKSRDTKWAKSTAKFLAQLGVKPNQVSIASIGFAMLSGLSFFVTGVVHSPWNIVCLIAAALCIQLRLLCNLFDGMIAVEHGQKSKAGEIYNDLPDRLADPLILIPVGYALPYSWGPELGWLAGLLAVLTAYVRVLGGSVGLAQSFIGPMAKPHRMATITIASLLSIVEVCVQQPPRVLVLALLLIVFGCVLTLIRRTRLILLELEKK